RCRALADTAVESGNARSELAELVRAPAVDVARRVDAATVTSADVDRDERCACRERIGTDAYERTAAYGRLEAPAPHLAFRGQTARVLPGRVRVQRDEPVTARNLDGHAARRRRAIRRRRTVPVTPAVSPSRVVETARAPHRSGE